MTKPASVDSILRQLDEVSARADALVRRRAERRPLPGGLRATAVSEARELHVGSAMLAGSVLFDSAIEHYRGSVKNPTMWLALATAATSLAAGIDGAMREDNSSEPLRDAAPYTQPRILGVSAGRLLSGLTAVGLLGTTAEAWLLHFRGNFQRKAMYLPVTLPPSAAAVVAVTTLMPHPLARRISRVWLAAVAVMGFVGVGFHMNGVARMMGGWKNWSQNMIDGPPIPAPPSFSGLAVAGMAALRLLGNKG